MHPNMSTNIPWYVINCFHNVASWLVVSNDSVSLGIQMVVSSLMHSQTPPRFLSLAVHTGSDRKLAGPGNKATLSVGV